MELKLKHLITQYNRLVSQIIFKVASLVNFKILTYKKTTVESVKMEAQLDEFCNRLELLQTKVYILKSASEPSNKNLLKTLRNTLLQLETDFKSLGESLEKNKAVNVELQNLLDKVIARNKTLDELIENNTSQIECKQETVCVLTPNVHSASPIRKKRTCLFNDIQCVTEIEFATVPKYMLGRFTLEALNTCIEALNKAVEKKYAIMSKKRSKLTSSEMKFFIDYSKEEADMPDLKGQKFVTEKNVAAVNGQKTLDKRSLNIMTILRHLKRIEEVRKGTAKYYLPNIIKR